ncbi:6-bladed beta-propeller [Melioribacteraceae bacterium 4301-Me]|uniref:6-bladed beta-propeller n=1 Tax=Pyranulibacter aquaticus TaxID=3163344 RepID=UPI003598CFD8
MLVKILAFLLIMVIIFSCDEGEKYSVYHSKYTPNYKLECVDSITYKNTSKNYLGLIKDIEFWNGYILIIDHHFKKLWVFDKKMNLLRSIGKEGRGPEEYTFPPYICADNKNFMLVDYRTKIINVYDSNLNFIKKLYLPKDIFYMLYAPIKLKNYFIIPASSYLSLDLKKNFYVAKSLFVADSNMNFVKEILPWDEAYKNENVYAIYNKAVLLTKGKANTFFARQQASMLIHYIDSELNIIKSFGIKAKFFKEPPDMKIENVAKSLDATAEYGSKTTRFEAMGFDSVNNRLVVYYVNLRKESWYNRSMLSGTHYLQIYNSNYDCIFDDEVDGRLAFVNNELIYLLTDENPDFVRIKIYRLRGL